jgi:Tol biopolymer transport system component
MRKLYLAIATLVLAATSASAAGRINPADARRVQAAREQLVPAIEKEFGSKARLIHLYGHGSTTLAGVIAEVPSEASDDLPLLAIVNWNERTGAVKVVDREFKYREARAVGPHVALLEANGDLRLREANGRERLLAQRVGGDLFPTPKGDALLATLTRTGNEPHETSIGLVDLTGRVKELADAPGTDAMPTVSPDGKTVVFVSGLTSVASFFRTSVDGAEPVQLTNKGMSAWLLSQGVPADFVPPPVSNYAMEWVNNDVLRYNAGGGEFWKLNVRTGESSPDLGGEK